MKKLIWVTMFVILIFTACSSKNEYPADVVQSWTNLCLTEPGSNAEMCSCLMDKVQKKYTYEEFKGLEEKMKAFQAPSDFIAFTNEAKAKCGKK